MLKIGICDNKPALWQAAFTQSELARMGVESEQVVIKAHSNLTQQSESSASPHKVFFTRAIEKALLHGEIDVAVHSMNELPANHTEGLVITAVSPRFNPADLLVIRQESFEGNTLLKLKVNASVGTSTHRCKMQLQTYRPDVQVKDIPDDVAVGLRRLRSAEFDAMILAAAVVEQSGLDLSNFKVLELPVREFVPAPAQGVLAWQTNRDDIATRLILKKIHHPEISACTNVERGVLQLMGENSQASLGVFCERDASGNFHAFAACETDGQLRRARLSSSTNYGMAEKLAEQLKAI